MGFKEMSKDLFWQLITIYIVLIVLVSLGLFWRYTYHFEFFALIVGILGSFLAYSEREKKKEDLNKFGYTVLFSLAIILIIVFRIIPYLDNSVPLGYDYGIYKYAIDNFWENGFGADDWVKSAFTPGFLYFSALLKLVFSTELILDWGYIISNVFLGASVYYFAKEYFDRDTGIIALLIYSVSAIQLKVFALMYYKNVLALVLVIWALYFLKRDRKFLFVLFGVLTGIFHRPTFFLFGLAYLVYVLFHFMGRKESLLSGMSRALYGIVILDLTLIFYVGFIESSILPLFLPVVNSFISPGNSPGSFISFFSYQFLTLAYLPFAIIGFGQMVRLKKFNMLFFFTLVTAAIVYFKFFFFNRFIIHLDIALIILAAFGFMVLIRSKKKLGVVILILMLISAGFATFQEASHIEPFVKESDLILIQKIDRVEANASILVLSSDYSPLVLAYSERKTIAPGLFEENKWSEEEWERFWASTSESETRGLLSVYDKPLYLFAGTKEFNNPCFSEFLSEDKSKLYKYTC